MRCTSSGQKGRAIRNKPHSQRKGILGQNPLPVEASQLPNYRGHPQDTRPAFSAGHVMRFLLGSSPLPEELNEIVLSPHPLWESLLSTPNFTFSHPLLIPTPGPYLSLVLCSALPELFSSMHSSINTNTELSPQILLVRAVSSSQKY